MTPRLITLLKAESRCIEKIEKLEPHLDDPESWRDYLQTVAVLAAIEPRLRPEALVEVLTQAELAARLGVTERTIQRRAKRGELPPKRARRAR
jgi:DNA-directed RNA polymerase specialized sigma24 family protein